MSDPNRKNDPTFQITDSQFGGITLGNNSNITSYIGASPIQHPQANELKQKLLELQKTIDASNIDDYRKRDALSRLEQLAKELEKENTAERQKGIKYFLDQIVNIFDSTESIFNLANGIASLLGFSL